MKRRLKGIIAMFMAVAVAVGVTPDYSAVNAAGDEDCKTMDASYNIVDGWSTYTNNELPALTSIIDASVEKETKFTHNEWTGNSYTDVDGNTVAASEVFAINRKADSATSTSYVSYDAVDKAIVGARDYKKDASKYVQFLTGKDESVSDWSLVVVKNKTEANARYRDFYRTGYTPEGDWKDNLSLPASWQYHGFDYHIYANVTMPWQNEYVTSPRCATNYNPVGMYRKNFKVNQGLADANGRVNISFQGVESCYYVYVNGKEVGYSEDTYSPHSFDITDYLIKNADGTIDTTADNLLAVEVHKFCDGTWFEGQDFFYDGGIFRDVYLFATPLIHLEDYFVKTDLDDNYVDADIILSDMQVVNYSTSDIDDNEYAIDVALYNEDGSVFMNGWSIDVPALAAGENGQASLTDVNESCRTVYSPKLWSCEDPNLYVMVLTLYNKKTGAYIESLSQNLGFREVEFTRTEVKENGKRATNPNDYQQMLINGQPFYFKGVNRHDTDPLYGKYVPHETQFEDIRIMKQNNINAVRTSHYSNDEYLYYLCEKYGLYMMAETNVECHALQNSAENLKTPFKKLVLDRTQTAFERLKNRTANVMWSTGNENYYNQPKTYCNGMFFDLIWYFKDHDTTRPVHCESDHNENGVDVDSDMYPYNIKGVINKGNVTMPYLMCEYDHGMGNAVGSIKEYWEAVRGAENQNILGGFIWDYVDQARFRSIDDILNEKQVTGNRYDYYAEEDAHQNLYAEENDGKFFSYGGDNGDNPNDNSFCCNGLLSPDRDVQPEMNEVKYQYQNFWFNGTTDADIAEEWVFVYNESSFDNLSKYSVFFELYEDGTLLGSEEIKNVDVGPRQENFLAVPYIKYMPASIKAGSDYYLNIVVKTKTDFMGSVDGVSKVIIPAGHVMSNEQFIIPDTVKNVTRTIATNKVEVNDSDDCYEVSGDLFSFKVMKDTGVIKDYYYRNELVLTQGPTPNFWRAPLNNDKNFDWAWQNVGKSAYVDTIDTSVNDNNQNVINIRLLFDKMDNISVNYTYTIDGSGAVSIDIDYDLANASIDNKRVLRIGTDLVMPEGFENVYWYGKGGFETMVDRCSAAKKGSYETTVSKMFYPYVDTQDTGNVTGVKWFTVTDSNKKAAIAIASEKEFEASALHFTADQLTEARHPYDLEKQAETFVSINSVSSGAGNASCGPDTLDEYRLYVDQDEYFTYDYSYTLVPYTATNAWGDMTGYVSNVTRQYRQEADNYSFAVYSDPDLPDPRPTATPVPVVTPANNGVTPTPVASKAPAKVTKPAKINKIRAKYITKSKAVKLMWKKISSAKGYEIQRSLRKNKGFKKIKVLNKKTIVKYMDKKVKKGKTYYYRVRAFKLNGKKKVYGKWSKVIKIKVKK